MPLKNTDLPLSEIARQLNVSHIVEGSVLRVGDRVRISALYDPLRSDPRFTDLLKRMGLEE